MGPALQWGHLQSSLIKTILAVDFHMAVVYSVYLDGDDTRWNHQQASSRAGLANAGKRVWTIPACPDARFRDTHKRPRQPALRGGCQGIPEALTKVPPHLSLSQRPIWGVWRILTAPRAHTRLLWNLSAQMPCGTANTLMDYTDLAQSIEAALSQHTNRRNDAFRCRPAEFAGNCICESQPNTIDL